MSAPSAAGGPKRPGAESQYAVFRAHAGPAVLTTALSGLVFHPIVTVGLRLQFGAAVKGAQEFKGMADVSRTILREGWNSFYRGIGLRLLQAPLAAIQVGSYGMFRSELARTEKFTVDTIKPLAYFIGSRVLVTTLKSPVEIVKERMQVDRSLKALPQGMGAWQAARALVEKEGFRGLFSGLFVTLLRDVPIAAINLPMSDFYTMVLTTGSLSGFGSYMSRTMSSERQGKTTHPAISMLAGALSGATACVITQPFDLAKTLLQTQGLARQLPNPVAVRYSGVIDVLRTRVKEGGFVSLYRGFVPRLIHFTFGNMVYFPLFRFIMSNWYGTGKKPSATGSKQPPSSSS